MKLNLNIPVKLAVAILIFATSACGSAPTPPVNNEISTIVAGTLAVLQPSPTVTIQPTTAPLATSTLAPTPIPPTSIPPSPIPPASNLPVATRISFASGATDADVEGTIGNANYIYYYVIRALKGQPMMVTVLSPNNDVKMSVFGANGVVLLSALQQQSGWQGTLPATQDYYIGLTGSSDINFLLNVVIPSRVQFASGQTQITLTGQAVKKNITYVAYALGGQKMDISINTDASVAAISVWGFSDGQPYARAQNGTTNFSMTLPTTQDYIIEVVPHTDQVVNYQVNLKIQ